MPVWLEVVLVLALLTVGYGAFVLLVARFCGFNERTGEMRPPLRMAERALAPRQVVRDWPDRLAREAREQYWAEARETGAV